jgi:NTP pyrophosphatase (non-canonical NTP hydrolase)
MSKKINSADAVMLWLDKLNVVKPSVPTFMSPTEKELHINLVQEEVTELLTAVQNNDMKEICDGLADSLWVITQLGMLHGININEVVRECLNSNMSKFCSTEQEAIDTVEAYHNGTHPDKEGVSISVYYEQRGDKWIVLRLKDDKVMKSINFKQPDFSNIVDRMKEECQV